MEALTSVHKYLANLAQRLNLSGPGPISLDSSSLRQTAVDLQHSIEDAFPGTSVAIKGRILREIVHDLVSGEPNIHALRLISQLETVTNLLQSEMANFGIARAWRLAKQLDDVAQAIEIFCRSALFDGDINAVGQRVDTAAFLDEDIITVLLGGDAHQVPSLDRGIEALLPNILAGLIAHVSWFRQSVAEFDWQISEAFPSSELERIVWSIRKSWHDPSGKDFLLLRPVVTVRLVEEIEMHDAAQLSRLLRYLEKPIEAREREQWLLAKQRTEQSTSPVDIYLHAWHDMIPALKETLAPARLVALMGHCAEVCAHLRLDDIAQYAADLNFLMPYAMDWLLPPAPSTQNIASADDLQRILDGQISRWYFCPFNHSITPCEMVASVLKTGRPLYYERVVAHALIQYGIINSLLPTDDATTNHADMLACLYENFELLLDGYLLRVLFVPQLTTLDAWGEYLNNLVSLHFYGQRSAQLTQFRDQFLSERGLDSEKDILLELSQRF